MLGAPSSHVPSSLQFMLHCMGLLLALSGHSRCPLLGGKRTSPFQSVMSAFDPKRTFNVIVSPQANAPRLIRPSGARRILLLLHRLLG
jgi:hypothetical protein